MYFVYGIVYIVSGLIYAIFISHVLGAKVGKRTLGFYSLWLRKKNAQTSGIFYPITLTGSKPQTWSNKII